MEAPQEHLIEAESISKVYSRRTVVDQVNLKVRSGEIVGLLGPNGAGKTTSFYMVVGLVAPTKGKVKLDGDDITSLPVYARARRGIGYLPQEPSVFRKLSVRENVLAILETMKFSSPQAREERLAFLLEELGVSHVADSLATALSGGERRRVEICRALAREPHFLLLDEPFAGIDPIAVKDIQEIIVRLKQHQIGILITDHNVRETLGICDRAYILVDGNVMEEGEPAEIAQSEKARRYYLGSNFALP